MIPAKRAPKNVLPASPMNNLAGHQLNIKKAKREENTIINDLSKQKDDVIMITAMQPETNPSMPSIKFVKFIIDVISNKRARIVKRNNETTYPEE